MKYNAGNSASIQRQQQAHGFSESTGFSQGNHPAQSVPQPMPQTFIDSKFQTLKIKNSGLKKYQRQFQGSQPNLLTHNNPSGSISQSNSQQPSKLIIQSQHGRNLKRQALGSGGVQVRSPMILQQNIQTQSNNQMPSQATNLSNQQQMPQPPSMALRAKALSMQKSGGMIGMPTMPSYVSLGAGGGPIREGDGDVVGLRRVTGMARAPPPCPPPPNQFQQNTVIAVKQNKLNKLQKHQNIHNVGGDQMSENGSNSVGVDQDEDVPETLSDENNGMYRQMNIKDAPNNNNPRDVNPQVEQAKSKLVLKPESQSQLRSRFLSPNCVLKPTELDSENNGQLKAIYHSPQNQLQSRPLQFQNFESQNKNQEDQDVLKSECESMHKLIKELNEQAMDMLYSANQKNVSLEGGPGSAQEYLVIQRKLSEIKQSALNEPDIRGKGPKDDEQDCSDLQKSLKTLEKALKILTIQHQKQRILVKPIYISIITYNIACCHQQTNNLKKCDKLLAQSIKLLEEDIETIDKLLNEFQNKSNSITNSNNIKKRKIQKIEDRVRHGRRPVGYELEAKKRAGSNNCYICQQLVDIEERSQIGFQKCIFENHVNGAIAELTQEPIITPCSLLYLKYTRLRQLTILLLQHCAILSQLNRHADALGYAHSTTRILHRLSLLAVKIVQGKTNNLIEMDRIEEDKERVEQSVDEYYKLHKWLKAVSEESSNNIMNKTPDEKLKPYQNVSSSQSVSGSNQNKKERRGRNGRKPSVMVNASAQKLNSGSSNYDVTSLRSKKKNSTSGIYDPLQSEKQKGEKFPRSRSQNSRRSYSKYSDSASNKSRPGSVARSRSSSSVLSACLSNISRKQKKNIKQINAGLERLHTFGMSSIHKGILDIQEQKKFNEQNKSNFEEDKQPDYEKQIGAKKTIQKTTSQKKLQGPGQTQTDDKSGKIDSQNNVSQHQKGTFMKKKQSVTPLTSLKFLNPKEIQNSDAFDNLSKVSSEVSHEVGNTDRDDGSRKGQNQTVSSSLEVDQNMGSLFRQGKDGNVKLLSQSVEFEKDESKGKELNNQEQEDDLKLPDVLSDVNSGSRTRDNNKKQTSKAKFSYYVRDQFQPLQKQKDNIEKLLRQFSDHQKDFLDIIFQNEVLQDLNSSGGIENLRGYDSGASGSIPLNLVQKQSSFSSLVIKNLKLSFQSIEEIERLKRDFNMYRQTQRNQLGISKPTKLPGEFGSRRQNRLNWIDLFNIGNVMLMRGQDIQMSHKGWNEICEFDSLEQIIQQEIPKPLQRQNSRPSSFQKQSFKNKLNQRDSRNMDSTSSQGSNLHPQTYDSNKFSNFEQSLDDLPELCLQRCNKYSISKDSFTEIVLLTVISYFCVSTEHRFINMNQDREKQQQKQKTNNDKTGGNSMFDLNNSNQSMPSTIRSAGIQGSGLNSTLQRSTKEGTHTSSTQRQLAAKNQKNLDGNKSVHNTNFQSSNNSSVGNQKHIQSVQEKGVGLQVHQNSQENNTAMLSNLENRGSNSERYSQVDHQEYFLCKALHFGLLYLPPDSPLVQHLTQNYIKNYLQPRLQKREDLVNKFMQ